MKTIVILTDSVNRHYLEMYGNQETRTPNLERLRERSCVFNSHWTGSAPCMPARRDMLTGRLCFLERNWGPIEPFDHTLPELLQNEGVRSHIETDHYHYLELGGEGYCQSFTTWRLHRGQEADNMEWLRPGEELPRRRGKISEYYEVNRKQYLSDSDYSSPKTYQTAARWLEDHGDEEDFLLWVEGFDPHEPFDVPEEYLAMYGDDYTGEYIDWPSYEPFDGTETELRHLRNRYAATLTLTDHWIGKILDVCDEKGLWDDTMIIFTSDHGFMLGEHGFMAKNYMQAYNEVFHIPLCIHQPGQVSERRVDALTQNIDLFPTIAAHHGIPESRFRNPIHGKNLLPIMNGSTERVRDAVIYGLFGKSVNIHDGRYTFFKSPTDEENLPLSVYTAMPTSLRQFIGPNTVSDLSKIEMGRFFSWTDYPLFRIRSQYFEYGDKSQGFRMRSKYDGKDYLFDLNSDYAQENDLSDPETRNRMVDLLRRMLEIHDAPQEQFTRLGL